MKFQCTSDYGTDNEIRPFRSNDDLGFESDMYSAEVPTSWSEAKYHVYLFGRTAASESVTVRVPFRPELVIRSAIPPKELLQQIFLKQQAQQQQQRAPPFHKTFVQNKNFWLREQMMHDAGGFHPDMNSTGRLMEYRFIFISFLSHRLLQFFRTRIHRSGGLLDAEIAEDFMHAHPILQFWERTGLAPCRTLEIADDAIQYGRQTSVRISTARHEIFLSSASDLKIVEDNTIFPLVILSFDIETVPGGGGNHFPDALRAEDRIVSICNTTWNSGTGEMRQIVHGLGEYRQPTPPPATDIPVVYRSYKTEKDLLLGWRDYLLVTEDPDIITGWNIDGYDWKYIRRRHLLLFGDSSESGISGRFGFFSRLVRLPCLYKESQFSSGAYGASDSAFYLMPGRVNMDLLTYVKRNFKFDNYRLDTVCRELLKTATKIDLPIRLMFEHYLSADPDRRAIVHEYCRQDTLLPIRLIQKQMILPAVVEMSRVTYVGLLELLSAGQSIKVLSMLYIFARQNNFVLGNFLPEVSGKRVRDAAEPENKKKGYKGGCVLDAMTGLHPKAIVFDFTSLYPSIIQAYNLDYTSFVIRPTAEILALPGYQFKTVETDIGTCVFEQSQPGLIPRMAKKLLESRKLAQKAMAVAAENKNQELVAILNAKQLALKVSANSIYGFTGAPDVAYPLLSIAASTTALGRQLIVETARIIKTKFRGRIVMGDTDSVFADIRAADGTELGMEEAFKLGTEIQDYCNSTYQPPLRITLEKILGQLLVVAKKKYAGVIYISPTDGGKLYVRGLGTVRRDFTPWQRTCLSSVLRELLVVRSAAAAVEFLRQQFSLLRAGKISMSELVRTAQLRSEYKSATAVAQQVANRMNEIQPGKWRTGDRVEMIAVVRPGFKYHCDRMEDPQLLMEKGLRIDYIYYLESIKSAIEQFFLPFPNESRQVKNLFSEQLGAAKMQGFQTFTIQKTIRPAYGSNNNNNIVAGKRKSPDSDAE